MLLLFLTLGRDYFVAISNCAVKKVKVFIGLKQVIDMFHIKMVGVIMAGKSVLHSSRVRLGATSGLMVLMMSMSVCAQSLNDGGAIELPQLNVDNANDTATGPVNGYVANNTFSGSKTNTPIQEIPQSVSVIGRQELDAHQPQKIDEALRYTAGVQAQPWGQDPRTDWIYIRGFQATQTGIFLNGLPLYQFAFGGFKVEPFTLERVEVLKGPASVLYGGSNPGGLVNLVSKMPTTQPVRHLEAGVDGVGRSYGAFDFGGALDQAGQWSYRLSGKVTGGPFATDHTHGVTGAVAPALTYKPSADTTLTLLGQYQHDDLRHTGGFLPYVGTVVPARFGYIPRNFYYNEPALDKYNRDQALIGYQFEHKFNETWTVRQNVRYAHVHVEENGPYTYGYVDPVTGYAAMYPSAPGYLLNRIGFSHRTTVNTFSADNQAEAKFGTGPLNHTLLMGLDYKYYDIDQVQASGVATPLSPINPVYGALQGRTVPYLNQKLTMNQLGFYAQDQIKFGDGWIATLNGRYDRLWESNRDRIGTGDFNEQSGVFSGRAGLAYEFANGITPYVSVSRAFNPLIGTTADGKAYKPEIARQYEVGVKYKPDFFNGLITASFFDLTRSNVLTTDPANIFYQIQLGEVRSRGFEFEAKANLTEALKVTAAVTAYSLKIMKDPNASIIGNKPNGVPGVQAALWADYTLQEGVLKGLGFSAGMRYQSSSYADNENTLRVPSAVLFDGGIHYDYDKWNVALNVNNIFNKRYVSSCQTAFNCSYGEGRAAILKASYKW